MEPHNLPVDSTAAANMAAPGNGVDGQIYNVSENANSSGIALSNIMSDSNIEQNMEADHQISQPDDQAEESERPLPLFMDLFPSSISAALSNVPSIPQVSLPPKPASSPKPTETPAAKPPKVRKPRKPKVVAPVAGTGGVEGPLQPNSENLAQLLASGVAQGAIPPPLPPKVKKPRKLKMGASDKPPAIASNNANASAIGVPGFAAVATSLDGNNMAASASSTTENASSVSLNVPEGVTFTAASVPVPPPKKPRKPRTPKVPKATVQSEDSKGNEIVIEESEEEIEEPPDEELVKNVKEVDETIAELEKERQLIAKRLREHGFISSSNRKPRDGIEESLTRTLDGGKAHWDHLLDEMAWMSNDFRVERKWKVQSAKKLVREAERTIVKKEQEKKKEKINRVSNLRQQSKRIARDVRKMFWNKIDRIVVFKNNADFLAEQQEIMDRNLDRLLEQTEQYTASLVSTSLKQLQAKKSESKQNSEQELEQLEVEAISKMMSKYAEMPESKKQKSRKAKEAAETTEEPSEGATINGVVVTSGGEKTEGPSPSDGSTQTSSDLMSAKNLSENNDDDEEDASWQGSVEEDEEGSDMVDDDPEDDGRIDKLQADLEISIEELLEREYGISRNATKDSATEDSATRKNKANGKSRAAKKSEKPSASADDKKEEDGPPSKRLRSATTPTRKAESDSAKMKPANEDKIENDEDDESWSEDEEEVVDDEIDAEDENNPEDDGTEDALAADQNMSLEELLAKTYGITLEQFKEDVKEKEEEGNAGNQKGTSSKDASVAAVGKPSTKGSKKTQAVEKSASQDGAEEPSEKTGAVQGPEDDDEDESWHGEEEVDEDIASEDLNNEDDDGNVDGLEDDLNIPIEELLARRYGIGTAATTTMASNNNEGEEEVEPTEEQMEEAKRKADLQALVKGNAEDAADDDSYQPSSGESDSEDERALLEAEAEEEGDATAEDLAKDAAIPIEELLRTQYHMEGQIGQDMKEADKMEEVEEDDQGAADTVLSGANGKKKKKTAAAKTEETTKAEQKDEPVKEEKKPQEKMSAEEIEKLLTQSANEEIREHVPVPFLLTQDRQLRTYQREGLDWLVSLHDRQLNGILADEMGLGKTAQTISLLAHLAGSCNIWGPHLIVVPTSVILNWDMEFKTWCPGLKVITYFGSQAERAAKRAGWTKPNAFHVCVTSYQIAVQDHNVFQRKKWYYIICDEAHALKNSASKRWQTLLSFQAKRRLLITGTPLQNSLMELWSLMHFLMPEVFRSQHEFRHWFSNPLQAIVEEGDKRNAGAVKRLHTVMRPFILRRLKREVATQLPSKFEHVVRLPLARRQRFLYEDFISLSSTQDQLRSGGYVGMMSVLMKLRMVCNHPDLFEPRMVSAALCLDELVPNIPQCVENIFEEPIQAFPYVGLFVADSEFGTVSDVGLPEHAKLGSRLAAERALQLAPSHEQLDAVWDAAARASLPPAMNVSQTLPNAPDHVKSKIHELYERKSQEFLSGKMLVGRQVCLVNRRRLESSIPVLGSERISCLRIDRRRFGIPDSLYLYQDSLEARLDELSPVLERFVFVTPVAQGRVRCPLPSVQKAGERAVELLDRSVKTNSIVAKTEALLHPVVIRQRIAFPDRYLVQYDCGKLQTLAVMLRRLKRDNHRVLIFTQMSRMLDILERFLNLHSHTYFRLDGATKVEERQSMMDRFNRDPRIFCFILSTRSGGLGINLTGADTVIFYDSDWNPSMDAQAQDRAHRIGQTRDVHIYRLVSEQTIEENILLKSNQKRHLNRLSVEDGRFSSLLSGIDLSNEEALAAVEDESDRAATLRAKREELEMMGEEVEDDDNENDDDEDDDNEDDQEKRKPTTTTTTTTTNAGGEDGGDDGDEKLEDEKGNVLMTKAQFQELQSKLKPVDVYAIDFRTKHFLILDPLKDARRQKELERARLMEEQTKEWELQALEQSKRKAEAEAEEDMIANKDNVLDTATAKAVLRSARRCLKLERKVRKMTGRSWRKALEKRPGEKRAFYINDDTLETTWERPRIMDAEEERSRCRQSKWQKMHASVLERIATFLPSDQVHLSMARVSKHWWKAVEGSPRLAVFVLSPTYAREDETGTLMIGSRIEARHLNGDNWFPGTVIDCQRDGCLGVLYTDGEVEHRLQPSMVRKDRGSRITLVRRFEGDKPFGPVFEYVNPLLASGFGCGTSPIDPVQTHDILPKMGEYALGHPGTSFVLRPGTHSIGSGGVFGGPKTRLVGETVWAMEKDSYRAATENLLPDDDPKKRHIVKFDPSTIDPFELTRASVVGNPEAGDMYVDVAGGELVGIYFAVRVAVRADKDANVKFRHCKFARGLDIVSANKVELDACFFVPCVDRPAIVASSDPMAAIVLKRCSLAGSLMGLYFSDEEDIDLTKVSVVGCDLSNCPQGAVGMELNQTPQLLQRISAAGSNNIFTPGAFVRPIPTPHPLLLSLLQSSSTKKGLNGKEGKPLKDKTKKKLHKKRKSGDLSVGVGEGEVVSKVKKAQSPKKRRKKRMKMASSEVTVLKNE